MAWCLYSGRTWANIRSSATVRSEVTERAALLYLLRHSGRRWSAVAEEVEERGSALAVLQ